MLDDYYSGNITWDIKCSALLEKMLKIPINYLQDEGYLHVDLSFANPENLAWKIGGVMGFHLVFFSMVNPDDGVRGRTWPIGELYGIKKAFQKQAYTVGLFIY